MGGVMRIARYAQGLAVALWLGSGVVAEAAQYQKCRPGQPNTADKHCLVDGYTYWIEGRKYRLKGIDTPEPQTHLCGGAREKALAQRASARALELLNTGTWQIRTHGLDNTDTRVLVSILVDGRDLGEILVSEGLARTWPDGEEFWCAPQAPAPWWRKWLGL